MANILALDLSKWSTGWAVWSDGDNNARYGHWQLGSEFTSDGGVYVALHRRMSELCQLCAVEHLYFEDPIHPAQLQGGTNINSLRLLSGLAAHAESFAEAMRFRSVNRINVMSWRGDFIGKQPRGTKRTTLKDLTIERCRQLGFQPRRDDEADALGILTYASLVRGLMPPWLAGETLRPILGAGAGK